MGRPRKPAQLKVLEGNPGKRRISQPPLSSPDADPDPPAHLSEASSVEWRLLVHSLQNERLWTDRDRAALEVYVEALVTFREAVAYVRAHGVMVPGQKSGTRVKNPAIQIVRDSAGVIRAYGSEFGLTPYTRMQLGLPVQEVEDLDAGFERWQAERDRLRQELNDGE